MAIRFQRPTPTRSAKNDTRSATGSFGPWWASIAVISVAVMGLLTLGSSHRVPASPQIEDPTEAILASLLTAERALSEIDRNLATLCSDPVLAALELKPDCETGVIVLSDSLFKGEGGIQLETEAKEDVAAAVTTYLARLRQMPSIWESLESLEIRGHSDPRAFRNAYATNLVASQQRALGVLLYLVGPANLAEQDRRDLERLATVSGASSSRPPANCPESTRECYPEWRRVEIRPVLSEALRRGDWSRTLEGVRVVTLRNQQITDSETP